MLITIGIPTYNRAEDLGRLLQELLSQFDTLDQQLFEILISDNCSTDKTWSVTDSIKKQTDININYVRSPENLGYDVNISNIFKRASGEYVFLLGDDDGLIPKGLKIIYESILKFPNADAMIYGCSFYDKSLKNVIGKDHFFESFLEAEYYPNGEIFFSVAKNMYCGVSGVCIRKKAWRRIYSDSLIGTNWIHLDVLLSLIDRSGIAVIPSPIVKYRQGNKEKRWGLLETSFGNMRVIKKYHEKHHCLFRSIYKEHRHQARMHLISADGSRNIRSFRVLVKSMFLAYDLKRLSFWSVDILLLLLPNIFSFQMYQIYQKFKKHITQFI